MIAVLFYPNIYIEWKNGGIGFYVGAFTRLSPLSLYIIASKSKNCKNSHHHELGLALELAMNPLCTLKMGPNRYGTMSFTK